VELDATVCYEAVRSRDRRFEGRFVVAVTSTHVYCRPGCPAPIPRRENTRFYPHPAAAEEAGFRACLRCRPELGPGSPAWRGTEKTVARALRLIENGALDEVDVPLLAERLGVGERHLRRLFAEQVGASPARLGASRRAHVARRLLDETDLALAEVAACAGFASLRRFGAVMRPTFGKTPRALRRRRAAAEGTPLLLRLPLRPPFDWAFFVRYLAPRALPGVETIDELAYRRLIRTPGGPARIEIRPAEDRHALELVLPLAWTDSLLPLIGRAQRLFDLDADPLEIAWHLGKSKRLAPLVTACPGLRVPGAWDGFEVAVRTILGQQVSVAGATALAGRLVRATGEPAPEASPGLGTLFPTPAALAEADLGAIGLPRARQAALRGLATAVATGDITLDGAMPCEAVTERLLALPGIGPWTATYIAMRALGEPDAFPASDLGLRRAAGVDAAALDRLADAWRPFRAYAAMLLWSQPTPPRSPA
jgi:AraC family transcriptional regulator of adaptative response / DNA-3-methyladenine glycosylase II